MHEITLLCAHSGDEKKKERKKKPAQVNFQFGSAFLLVILLVLRLFVARCTLAVQRKEHTMNKSKQKKTTQTYTNYKCFVAVMENE